MFVPLMGFVVAGSLQAEKTQEDMGIWDLFGKQLDLYPLY